MIKKLCFITMPLWLFAAPNNPSSLTFVPSKTSTMLSWTDNSNDETGFKIYRNGHLIKKVGADVTSYQDTHLLSNTNYSYDLVATDDKEPNDASYLYHDKTVYGDEAPLTIYPSDDQQSIALDRDAHDLINTYTYYGLYETKSEDMHVSYTISQESGGFDVAYHIQNSSNTPQELTLRVPGILFGDKEVLNILNPYIKHYLEERNISTENSPHYLREGGDSFGDKPYFAVANALRTIEGEPNELHQPYGTQFVYAPVIVAHNDDFVVGASLNLDSTNPKHHIKPLMAIIKEETSWSYHYTFMERFQGTESYVDNRIQAGQTFDITLSVRVAPISEWIHTIHPYKAFFNATLEGEKYLPNKKDLRPIHADIFVDYNYNNPSDKNWAPLYYDDNTGELNLEDNLSNILNQNEQNGYKRMFIWNFTGLYKNQETQEKPALITELPFQFFSDDANIMPSYMLEDIASLKNNETLTNLGLSMGYDWGISGSMPAHSDGTVLGFNEWQPDKTIPFDYDNPSHLAYARHYLHEAEKMEGLFTPSFIRLDAFHRMALDGRVKWLNELQSTLPNVTFAAESSIDYMQARAASILQPDDVFAWENNNTAKGTKEEHSLSQPDFLALYLNPGAETYVWIGEKTLKLQGIDEKPHNAQKAYIQSLIAMGYTPLIEHALNDLINIDQISTKVPSCMDTIDNNGDGWVDWPYDPSCHNPQDDTE